MFWVVLAIRPWPRLDICICRTLLSESLQVHHACLLAPLSHLQPGVQVEIMQLRSMCGDRSIHLVFCSPLPLCNKLSSG